LPSSRILSLPSSRFPEAARVSSKVFALRPVGFTDDITSKALRTRPSVLIIFLELRCSLPAFLRFGINKRGAKQPMEPVCWYPGQRIFKLGNEIVTSSCVGNSIGPRRGQIEPSQCTITGSKTRLSSNPEGADGVVECFLAVFANNLIQPVSRTAIKSDGRPDIQRRG